MKLRLYKCAFSHLNPILVPYIYLLLWNNSKMIVNKHDKLQPSWTQTLVKARINNSNFRQVHAR